MALQHNVLLSDQTECNAMWAKKARENRPEEAAQSSEMMSDMLLSVPPPAPPPPPAMTRVSWMELAAWALVS